MNKIILQYIDKQYHYAIFDAWKDSDGYWVTLKNGWHVKDYFARQVIHEDTLKNLRNVALRIEKDMED